MIKRFVVVAVLAITSVAAAHADPVTGFFSINGDDSFTGSNLTFIPGTSSVEGTIGSTFATYLTDGNSVTLLPLFGSSSVNYPTGQNTVPSGIPPIFTTTENGETFSFDLTSYDADYVTNGSDGCASGATCLIVTGDGIFTGTGAVDYASSPGTFLFTTQYASGMPIGSTVTTYSSSASVLSAVPEPASLVLFGIGLIAIAGIARRKLKT